MGELVSIAIKKKLRGEMVVLQKAHISLVTGVKNDARGKPGNRQVSILTVESWNDACAEMGMDIPWTNRRANLLIAGIDLKDTKGMFLHIGGVVLEITMESSPCKRMDEAHKGLRKALKPDCRGGVMGKVVVEGSVKAGEEVLLLTRLS